MNQKTILIVAGLAVLAFVLMSASTREEPQIIAAPTKPTGKSNPLAGAGIKLPNISELITNFFNWLGSAERQRLENILIQWQTQNSFKGAGDLGYGDFLAGRMNKAQVAALLDRVSAYRNYLDTPAAFKSGTKQRVKDRYKEAANALIMQITDYIQKNI